MKPRPTSVGLFLEAISATFRSSEHVGFIWFLHSVCCNQHCTDTHAPTHSLSYFNKTCRSCSRKIQNISQCTNMLNSVPHTCLKCVWNLNLPSSFTFPPNSAPFFFPSPPHALFQQLHLFLVLLFHAHSRRSPPCPHLLNTSAIGSQACSWAPALLLMRPLTAACLQGCQSEGLAACSSAGVVL